MLNKKILAAAIIGGLVAAGSATAAPLSVTKQYYAQEIIIPSTGLVPATVVGAFDPGHDRDSEPPASPRRSNST